MGAVTDHAPAAAALDTLVSHMRGRAFTKASWYAHLIAVRACVDAMIVEADPEMRETGCPHLETEDVGTFGAVEQQCKACGQIV